MIDTSSVRNSLVTLAKKIESTDYAAAVRLRLLGDAVEGGPYAKGWGASDIYKLINPDLIVERYRSQHASTRDWLVEVLELARNVFIFVPIIITWLGISQATSKYHELLSQCLNKCPDQVSQPFLYLWEQGFGGRLPDVLRLSTVGLIDATILAIIFTLTFIVTLLSNANSREQDLRAQRLHGDLVHAIAGASLCLLDKQQQGLLNEANQSAAHLENAIKKLSDLDIQQKQWVGQFLDAIETLHTSIDRVESIVSNSRDFNNQQKMFLSQLEKEQEG